MTIAIQELRPESLSEAVEFAKQCGSQVESGRITPALSLVAVDDHQLVATALCMEQSGSRHRIEVGITDAQNRGDLHRSLVDKTLMKLASAGIRKFDIRTNGSDAQRDFWQAVSWIDRTLSPPSGDESHEAVQKPADAAPAASDASEAAPVDSGATSLAGGEAA